MRVMRGMAGNVSTNVEKVSETDIYKGGWKVTRHSPHSPHSKVLPGLSERGLFAPRDSARVLPQKKVNDLPILHDKFN